MMRRTDRIFSIFSLILLMLLSSCAVSKDYADVKSEPGVEAMHIPRTAMWMTRRIVGEDARFALKGFSNMDVIDCSDPESGRKVMDDVDRLIRQRKSVLLLETRERKETTRIYGTLDLRKGSISDLIVVTCEKSPYSLSVISSKGKIKSKEIEKLFRQVAK